MLLVLVVRGKSGVSSPSALSAGEESTPDASEKGSGSKGLRGVVNEGFRKGGAGLEEAVMKDDSGFGLSKT